MVVLIKETRMFKVCLLFLTCLFFAVEAQAASPCYAQEGGAEVTQDPWALDPGEQVYCILDSAFVTTIAFDFSNCAETSLLPVGSAVTDTRQLWGCSEATCSGDNAFVHIAVNLQSQNPVVSNYGYLLNGTPTELSPVILRCVR